MSGVMSGVQIFKFKPRNRVPLNQMNGKNHNPSKPKNKDARSNELGSNFQIQNHSFKGKEPILRIVLLLAYLELFARKNCFAPNAKRKVTWACIAKPNDVQSYNTIFS
jgi:hypothetical protein